MKKIGTWGGFSDTFKKRFRLGIYIAICIMIYLWTMVVGAQTWVECLILYENKSEVLKDLENHAVVEVSSVYANGDFSLEGYSDVYTEKDIEAYARVPFDMKPHYQLNTKYFITPITLTESRQICIKYMLLDIICYIMLVFVLLDAKKSSKKWWKIVSWVLFLGSTLIAQCAIDLMFGVLFGVGSEMDLVFFIKVMIPIVIILVWKNILKKKLGVVSGVKIKKHTKQSKKSLKK